MLHGGGAAANLDVASGGGRKGLGERLLDALGDEVERGPAFHLKRGACVVGEDNIICAQTGLAGSSILEKNVLLAGQVGISGHLTIHEGAIVYAQSGIGGDVAAKSRVSGSPAFDASLPLRGGTVECSSEAAFP